MKVVTGKYGIEVKVKEMTKARDDISSLKCVTRSCHSTSYLSDLFEYICTNRSNKTMPICRILRSSESDVKAYYNNSLSNLHMPLGRVNNYKPRKINTLMTSYRARTILLGKYELKSQGRIKVKEAYLGDLKFLIVGYDDKRKMLLSVKDAKISINHVGIYTEEPYIIDIFENMFETVWAP